jgi:hypothetical protein
MRSTEPFTSPVIAYERVLAVVSTDDAAIFNEAESRLETAKSLAQALCLVAACEGGTEILSGAAGALHVLMSDAMALYEAARRAMRPPPLEL